jgi:hypothetical protein
MWDMDKGISTVRSYSISNARTIILCGTSNFIPHRIVLWAVVTVGVFYVRDGKNKIRNVISIFAIRIPDSHKHDYEGY